VLKRSDAIATTLTARVETLEAELAKLEAFEREVVAREVDGIYFSR
jgi:hypothetical protein